MDGKIYQFEDYLLDVSEQRLQKDNEDISLPPKVFEVLTALVKRSEQLITYEELMEEVWQDTFVEETNLRYCIHHLRKTFDRDFIETVPKRGYRFNIEVKAYTVEEFIKKHTGSFKVDQLLGADYLENEAKPAARSKPAFFSKPAGLVTIAFLMTGIGILGYYIWQNFGRPEGEKDGLTIAVLPFTIIGNDADRKSEIRKGLQESLVFNLNKIKGLNVNQPKDIQNTPVDGPDPLQIGKELASDFVLEGSYRFEGDQLVQVNTRLLQTSDGNALINESITVKDESKINTEKIISMKIARKVFDKLAVMKDEEFVKTQKIGEEAAKYYLFGQQILRNFELNRLDEGVEAFEKIIKLEPNWAKGYAKYAEALVLLHGGIPDWEKAGQYAEKALEMDKNMPEAHLALGWYYQSKFEWQKAERSFEKAIELDPEYSDAYNEYGLLLNVERKFSEAEKQFLKAIELKPFDPFYYSSLCQHYYYDRKPSRAIENCQEALNLDSGFGLAYKYLFWIYVELGAYEDVFKNEFGNISESEIKNDYLARPLKDGNIKLYWQRRIEDRLANPKLRYSPLAIASFYAQLEDKEQTLKYLEELAETIPVDILYVNPDPVFDFIRKDPRFIEIINKFGLNP